MQDPFTDIINIQAITLMKPLKTFLINTEEIKENHFFGHALQKPAQGGFQEKPAGAP
jgi:hypothetical protein